MKVLVDVPNNEVFTFIENLKDKNYQIIEDREIFLSDRQLRILDERKNTPKNEFITREEFSRNIKERYGI